MNQNKIIEKPWGQEEVIEINDKYMVKKLTMWAGHRCSLQYHNIKKETIYVLSDKYYRSGDTITIPPKYIHRMEGIEDSVYLESSTPEMDDVVRVSDDYQRKT